VTATLVGFARRRRSAVRLVEHAGWEWCFVAAALTALMGFAVVLRYRGVTRHVDAGCCRRIVTGTDEMSYNPDVKHSRDADPALPPQPEADQTLAALLRSPATAPALHVPDGLRLDFGGLAEAAGEMAGVLRAAGVTRGDRVVLVVPDGPVLLQILLAVVSLGAAAAPLNPAYTHDEFVFFMEDLDPRLALLSAGEATAARAASSVGVGVGELLVEDGRPRGVQLDGRVVRTPKDFEPAQPDDVALLLHTSGTTSRPKQVPLSHRNLMASARAIAAHYRLGSEDGSFVAMPLFHVHGLVASVFAALLGGGRVIVPPRFSPQRMLDQLEPAGVTWFSAGPTLHQMVLERVERRGRTAAGELRFLRSCSSALAPELMARVEATFEAPLLEAYGMTEASHQIASNPLPPPAPRASTVGVAAGAEIRIADKAGAELPLGDAGEVLIRGPGLTTGYLGNPEANAEAFVDGWFRTGDLGSVDGDGYLTLVGRLKEMILRGGENIAPAEVEDVLRAHPAVVDAACFGVPDEKYGELVGAAVSLNADAGADALTAHCLDRLAAFKVPSVIHILDEVPRTATGKLQRRRIAARFVDS
jgi:acyl-CoA synthetase (AMP-forming)/AMP-acid ligase II